MPKVTRTTDRRVHGRGDNTAGVVGAKSNGLDQRTAGRYSPPISASPSAGAQFSSGVIAARTMGSGIAVGQGKNRAMGKVNKIDLKGGKA